MPSYPDQTTSLWAPPAEWTIDAPAPRPSAYDTDATAVFTHDQTGKRITTGVFPLDEETWAFRFANSAAGTWTFETLSPNPVLSGHTGKVTVEDDPTSPGELTHSGHWWTWSNTGEVIVPQLVMYDDPSVLLNSTEIIDRDIETFLGGHGFNGFHVPVFCRWLDIDKEANPEFDDPDPVPDPRTFEALELLIQKTYAKRGIVHLWLWGDNDANHRQTPMREDWGGKHGRVAERLYRYIAARLGPLPGWSMGFGFDLEHWAGKGDLKHWHDLMTRALGWPHLLGGRSGRPKDGPELIEIYDRMDYAGYTHLRPDYQEYSRTVLNHPDKPVFSEDRFRIRKSERHAAKDYDEERTRKGLWHSTMAGGVANIWGKMAEGAANGRSVSYPRPDLLRCSARFFHGRLTSDLVPFSSDGACFLRNESTILAYAEDAEELHIENPTSRAAVCVDARKEYDEVSVTLSDEGVIRLPYPSDWAAALSSET